MAVVACNTCRSAAHGRPGGGGPDGARLVDALRVVQAEPEYQSVAVQEMACLFACGEACTVHLRAPGKVGYVMGRFAADEDAARAILDYALLYAGSEIGQVPYAAWPDGVKGHFIARTPPAGFVVR